MSNVVVVYHSGYGHTRVMAQAVAQGVERHLGSTCQLIAVEEVEDHWDRLHHADAIIFGAPTYMGSASAPFKGFMEASAAFTWPNPGATSWRPGSPTPAACAATSSTPCCRWQCSPPNTQ